MSSSGFCGFSLALSNQSSNWEEISLTGKPALESSSGEYIRCVFLFALHVGLLASLGKQKCLWGVLQLSSNTALHVVREVYICQQSLLMGCNLGSETEFIVVSLLGKSLLCPYNLPHHAPGSLPIFFLIALFNASWLIKSMQMLSVLLLCFVWICRLQMDLSGKAFD